MVHSGQVGTPADADTASIAAAIASHWSRSASMYLGTSTFGLHRSSDLVFGFLAVEVVAPRRDQPVAVDLDDGRAVHRDRRAVPRSVAARRVVGGVPDPLEERPVVTAAHRGDLLAPVGHHLARLVLDVAQVV